MLRFAICAAFIFATPLSLFAATDSDSVQILLSVNNIASTSATTTPPTDGGGHSNAATTGNGSPVGPISPTGNTKITVPIFDGNVVVVPVQKEPGTLIFRWKTTVPVTGTLEWGETILYEIGSRNIAKNVAQNKANFEYTYQQTVKTFQPGERYFYRVKVTDEDGRVSGYQGVYDVPLSPAIGPLENVSGFSIKKTKYDSEKREGRVLLKWQNPDSDTFSEVRVVRSPFHFPKDVLDGKVVYEGGDEAVLDVIPAPAEDQYYYAVFAKTKDGRYSSGSIATSRQVFGGTDTFEKTSRVKDGLAHFSHLTANNFMFIRHDGTDRVPLSALSLAPAQVEAGEVVTLSADYELFPEVLKTILVHITPSKFSSAILPDAAGPAKNTESFLLSVNADSSSYEATFFVPSEGGRYDIEVQILDYHNDMLQKIVTQNAFEVEESKTKFDVALKNAKSQFFVDKKPLLLAIFLLFILLTLALRKIVSFS
ncbi:MAG: hypothetical protein WCO79_02855 [bacterium]